MSGAGPGSGAPTGHPDPRDEPAGRPPAVAAFDFDGTLTPADTFLGFLRRVAGSRAVAVALARAAAGAGPRLGRSRVSGGWTSGGNRSGRSSPGGRTRRDEVKAALVATLLAGRDAAEMTAAGEEYGAAVARVVTPDMRRLLDGHAEAGHLVVLVSASLDLYVGPAARALGAHSSLATRLEVGSDGLLTGRLDGPNCRGMEKARRLSAWLEEAGLARPSGSPERPGGGHRPAGSPVLWAYGDSAGDRELWAMADMAVRVRRGRPPVQAIDAVRDSSRS